MYLKFLHRLPSLTYELTGKLFLDTWAVRKEEVNMLVTKSVISGSRETKKNYTSEKANLKQQKKDVV